MRERVNVNVSVDVNVNVNVNVNVDVADLSSTRAAVPARAASGRAGPRTDRHARLQCRGLAATSQWRGPWPRLPLVGGRRRGPGPHPPKNPLPEKPPRFRPPGRAPKAAPIQRETAPPARGAGGGGPTGPRGLPPP